MEISGQTARRRLRIKSIRILNIGVFAGVLYLTHRYTVVTPVQATVIGIVAVFFLLSAASLFAYSLWKKFPNARVTFDPQLKLPKSLVSGGLDCSEEPIDFWLRIPISKNKILLGTENRHLYLTRSLLLQDQWQRLIEALPNDKEVQPPAMKDSISVALLVYAIFFVATHFMLDKPSNFQVFNYLAHGGYNASMAAHGELYRLLSYSWVHGNDTHLWMNLVALIFVAQALGKSFSNATLASVLIVTAMVSGFVGNLTKDFNVLVGASGAIMGAFGFLFAAQRNKDKRLNPLARLARQKILYVLLLAEFALSLRYSWYGGSVHLAGIATGYGLYSLMAATVNRPSWQTRSQVVVLSCGLILFGSWAAHTYQTLQKPKLLVQKALATRDPFLTFSASTALPDLPNATRAEVVAARRQSLDLLRADTLLAWPLARTDYWLGNNRAALATLRKFSAAEPNSTEIRDLWLAVERDLAAGHRPRKPVSELPKGPATAYLISADSSQLARIKLPSTTAPVEAALRSRKKIEWYLLDVTAPLQDPEEGAYGVWLVPKTKFRTAATVKVARVAQD